MTIVLSILFFVVACILAAFVLSDVLLQHLAMAVRGSALTPRQLLTVRKVGYVILVLFLFTWAFTWRRWVVDATAANLAVREQSRGDVHLGGSLMRLSLGGFRGVTTCYLWNLAMDKQMKNQLNELEVIVGWLTELQPHFNTPWLFQSWNLAYNVSNKTDRISDKYFYISRGVRLLADGERQNHDDPDLRFELATTYQHKICQSDETNYHRSLFQLSLIPPNERDPARFRDLTAGGRQKLNMKEFAQFCEDHPQLIRRLREGVHKDSLVEQHRLFTCPTPNAVVQFLADNYRVPSLYREARPTPPGAAWVENKTEKPDSDTLERFPVLPPPHPYPPGADEDLTDESPYSQQLDAWDAYLVARTWYSYAQEPLPPPSDMPGEYQPVTDRVHQRLNRHMSTILFRQNPASAQRFIAQRLEEEGWFDDEGWSTKGPEWFNAVIGSGQPWAANAWEQAYVMWLAYGKRNHLYLEPDAEAKMQKLSKDYQEARRGSQGKPTPEDPRDSPEGQEAFRFQSTYDAVRGLTNFPIHLARARVEKEAATVRARRQFYEAEALASTGSTLLALEKYQKPDPKLGGHNTLDAWTTILTENAEFRGDDLIAEQSYEIELNYLDVLNRALPANEIKTHFAIAAQAGAGMAGWPSWGGLAEGLAPRKFPGIAATKGPFEQLESNGVPWIKANTIHSVQERRRLFQPRKKEADDAPAPPKPAPIGMPTQQPPG